VRVATGFHPRINPAGSTALRPRKTGARNGITDARALPKVRGRAREQAVGRKPRVGGIAREANAPGKAGGYADAGTTARKVGERVGVNRP
jgi:hypothetical protein